LKENHNANVIGAGNAKAPANAKPIAKPVQKEEPKVIVPDFKAAKAKSDAPVKREEKPVIKKAENNEKPRGTYTQTVKPSPALNVKGSTAKAPDVKGSATPASGNVPKIAAPQTGTGKAAPAAHVKEEKPVIKKTENSDKPRGTYTQAIKLSPSANQKPSNAKAPETNGSAADNNAKIKAVTPQSGTQRVAENHVTQGKAVEKKPASNSKPRGTYKQTVKLPIENKESK